MPISIRRRLLIRLITAIAIGWLVAIGFVYYAAYHEVEEVFDATLAQEARVLATLMTHESEGTPRSSKTSSKCLTNWALK
jgi:two-component system sensor histidine kinase QseC